MFWLIIAALVIALALVVMRDRGVKIHNPPPEELAKIEAVEAEAATRRAMRGAVWGEEPSILTGNPHFDFFSDCPEAPTTTLEMFNAGDVASRSYTPLMWEDDDYYD